MSQVDADLLAGQVALVTGGASGIGAASALLLARHGATVMLGDRDLALAGEMARQIAQAGGCAHALALDVADEASWEAACLEVEGRFGGIDVLVNNAGITAPGAITDLSLADWHRVLAVNLDGVFLGLRQVGRRMVARRRGAVVNLASVMSRVAVPNAAAYVASKGAVAALTKVAALEWAPFGVRVNSLHPGYVDTPMVSGRLGLTADPEGAAKAIAARHPLGRLGQAGEIAEAVLFLASSRSQFTTGAELVVDGGYTAA